MKQTKGATKLQRMVPASWKTLVRVMGLDVVSMIERDRRASATIESYRRQSATERKEEEKIMLLLIS